MGMILGHHIPPPLGPAPAVDVCSYSTKFDGVSPSIAIIFRYDVRIRADGLRAWTRHGGVSIPAFDNMFQYDLPAPWALAGWVFSASQQVTNDTFVRTMDWHDEGRKLTMLNRWFSSFRRLDTFDQSATPYDITVFGPGFASRTGIPGGEFLVRFNLEASAGGTSSGSHVFISRSAVRLERHLLTVPHDISTMVLTPDQVFDASPFGGRMDQMTFSADHTRIYSEVSTTEGPRIGSWDLTAPDDISAPFNYQTGPFITVFPEPALGVARGWNVRPDTGDIVTFGDQNNYRVRCWSGGQAATTDLDFNDVVLLLDFAGPDNGTNITDLSNSGHTDSFFGNAHIDYGVRMLGENSSRYDGAGDYITFPDSDDWDFGTGDFAIEFGTRLDVINTAQTFMGNYLTGAGNDKGISVEIDASNNLRVLNGDSVLYSEAWVGVANNTQYQIAVTRSGTSLRVFVGGVQLGATVVDSTNFTGSVQPWRLGTLDGAAQFIDGYLGAVRITKGVPRYTADYTPQTCFYAHLPVPRSPVVASGAPSITKPTSAGVAVVTSTPAIEAGPVNLGGPAGTLLTPSPTEAAGDRIFVYGSNNVPTVDGTWTQLATAGTGFSVYTKVAAGDATDEARAGSSVAEAVCIKFTMKDIAGAGSWDFNAQSTLRNTFRTAFDCNSLAAFGTPAPSCSFFAGLRIGSGVQPGTVGDFSDPLWNAPPNGGTILKVKSSQVLAPFNTFWSAISFLCEPTKVAYATGKFWSGANSPTSHLTQTRGFRYDHD